MWIESGSIVDTPLACFLPYTVGHNTAMRMCLRLFKSKANFSETRYKLSKFCSLHIVLVT